jgi:methionine biosynthesis protein MetW
MKEEYKKTYFDSGVEFSKNQERGLARSTKLLPKGLLNIAHRKMKEHEVMLIRRMWSMLEGKKKILDVGCGRGQFMIHAPRGVSVFGIDIIDSELAYCRKLGLEVKKCDIEKNNIPYKDSSFDGIYFSHVIEHLQNPYAAMNKIRRVMKTGGRIVVATPNFSTHYKHFYDDPTHKTPFTKQSLYRILNDNGFKNIRIMNDVYHSHRGILSLFVPFPRLKFALERLFGRVTSQYMIAIAEK